MRILEAQTTFRLKGRLERHRGRRNIKPPTPVQLSDSTTIKVGVQSARVSISMFLMPFEELYHAKSHTLLTCSLYWGQSHIKIVITYERCRRLKAQFVSAASKETVSVLSDPFKISVLQFNEVKISLPLKLGIPGDQTIKAVCKFSGKEWSSSFKGLVKNPLIELFDSAQTNPSCNVAPVGKEQIPDISHFLELTQLPLVQAATNNFRSQKSHFIPKLRSGPKMLVCHDMAGGYREDINEYSVVGGPHNYRFHHFGITDIFIYFSHYNFAPPTRGWVQACHSNNVLCLGTFIVQQELDYVRKETADYLVYLAKEYQFDGYLINIEYGVKDVKAFSLWLKYLVKEMHSQLPNSVIIFYDSVIDSGKLQWQSQLNSSNFMFLEMCDYFFTDYHWTIEKLQECWSFAESLQRTSDVFIGTDVFGRGTFGGGKFETYKGVTESRSLGFSVALFAQAFTYENGGMESVEIFQLQDDALFFGKRFSQTKAKDEMWRIVRQGGNGWKKEGDDWVTSFDWCQRQWVYPIQKGLRNPNTVITFLAQVKGTPPKVQDPFLINVEGFGQNGIKLLAKSSNLTTQPFNSATAEWQIINISVDLKEIGGAAENLEFIRITEIGKDLQVWGGVYGTRFKNQRLLISSYVPAEDLSNTLGTRPVTTLPFHSYFNAGQGKNYYWKGQPTNDCGGKCSRYSCLRDYDLPYQDKSLDPTVKESLANSSISYENAWIGGSSIRLKCLTGNKGQYKLLNLSSDCSKGLEVRLKVKQNNNNKYVLVVNLEGAEQRRIDGAIKPIPDASWKEVAFSVEPNKSQLKSLILELALETKDEEVYLGQLLVADTEVVKQGLLLSPSVYQVSARLSPLKTLRNKQYVDLLIKQPALRQNLTLPISLVPIEKSRLVFINSQFKGSLGYRQQTHFIQAAKLDNSQRLLVEIISVDLLGSFRTDYRGEFTLSNSGEFEWHSSNS